MLDTFNTVIICNKNYLKKFKFIFIIILLLGMNGWVFEQKILSNSKNDLSFRQISPLSSPREEKNPETDISSIYNEDSFEQPYLFHNEDERDTLLVDQKIMASGSQMKDAFWYYDNLIPDDRKKIRQAMDYAIPRDQIINNIMNDTAIKTASPVGQQNTGIYDTSIQARDYDQVMALDLLEQVFGYRYNDTTDPYFEMTLMAPTSIPARIQWATLTAQTLSEIGIDVELKLWDWDPIISRVFDPLGIGYDFLHGGFDAFFIGWSTSFDMNYTDLYSSESFVPNESNYIWLNNSLVDIFLDQAYTARQLDDRIQALRDFQTWFYEEVPKSMILQFLEFFGTDPLVEGLDPYLVNNGPWVNNITIGTQTDLTYTVPQSFLDFNPACSNSHSDAVWANNVYLSLAERRGIYNSTHLVPLVAESWTSSSDGLEWNVTIRDGIKWDDGSDLTVDDVIYTYHSQFQDTTQSKNQYLLQKWFPNNVSDIVKLNDSTIQFTTGSFNPFMESQIFGIKILQRAQMETITNWDTDNTNHGTIKLHGCGPYMFKSYNGYDTVELEVNPYYDQAIFGHDPNAIGGGVWWPNASIPTVFFKEEFSAEEAVTGLETALYDIIDYRTGLKSYIDEIEASTWGKLFSAPIGGVQELGYNQYSPIWGINPKDPRTMYPEHDLELLLETPLSFTFDEAGMINTTITNYGWANETDVELQLWIDETLETTQVFPYILGSATEIFSYSWTPTEIGTFNVTAYVVPVTNETLIRNNNMTIMTNVVKYVPSAPIYIYSDAQLNSTFPGTGTIDDPILIEWYNITSSSGTLIYISDTTYHFRIANCILNGMSTYGDGIQFYNVINGTIFNNTIFQNENGILLRASSKNNIYSNLVFDNIYVGIRCENSENNTIFSNTVFGNQDWTGIWLSYSNYNNLTANTAHNNNGNGIDLTSSDYNIISNNIAYNNLWSGINLWNFASNNFVYNNTVFNNFWNGITFTNNHNNALTENNVYSNQDQGIYLETSSNNVLSNNTINNNGGGINLWDSNGNIISSNAVYDNSEYGFSVRESNGNIVTGNNVYNNIYGGIYMWDSNNHVISNNTIHNNEGTGISFSNSHDCTILNNTIYDNNFAGMVIADSDNNIISNNTVYYTIGGNNERRGIALWASGNNYICNNTVSNIEFAIQINPYDFNIEENNVATYNIVFNNINGFMVGGTNNQITNNLIYNNELGIQILESVDNHISFNSIIYNSWHGIWVESANYVTISNNILHDNGGDSDINIRGSSNCFISDNTIFYSEGNGILIEAGDGEANNNVVTGNTIYDNPDSGIKLLSSNYNSLTGNHIYSNAMNGINLGDSDHNIISDNIIENNPNEGIYLENSDYNTITRNQFVSGPNANDHGSNNIFILNYWSGWTSPDADGDGIVDNPYSIGSENQDLYPLVSPDVHAFAPPSLSFPNGDISISGTTTIQWVAAVDSFDHPITYTVSYSSDGGNSWISLQTGLISTSYEWNTKTVSDGNTYLVRVVATCSEGFTKEDISGQFNILNVEPITTTSTKAPSWNAVLLLFSLFAILSWRRRKK
ncbi:MAG: right-handed parallel beta-helix repeat-containing protein [Candidatus Hodarchaeales archaeon]|jgi:parallel beta-helix repeat protein